MPLLPIKEFDKLYGNDIYMCEYVYDESCKRFRRRTDEPSQVVAKPGASSDEDMGDATERHDTPAATTARRSAANRLGTTPRRGGAAASGRQTTATGGDANVDDLAALMRTSPFLIPERIV